MKNTEKSVLELALADKALEPWYGGAADDDLDSYGWDAAKNAAMA